MDRKKAAFWIGGAAFAVFLWLSLSSSDELAIDIQSCKPAGLVAEAKASLQGHQFKKDQVQAINRALAETQRTIDSLYAPLPADVQQAVNETKKIASGVMEGIYKDRPDLRPSPKQVEAKRLREIADALDKQAQTERNARLLVQYGQQLGRCRSLLSK